MQPRQIRSCSIWLLCWHSRNLYHGNVRANQQTYIVDSHIHRCIPTTPFQIACNFLCVGWWFILILFPFRFVPFVGSVFPYILYYHLRLGLCVCVIMCGVHSLYQCIWRPAQQSDSMNETALNPLNRSINITWFSIYIGLVYIYRLSRHTWGYMT